MAQTVERSADRAAHRPGFSVSRGQQAKATRRSREDRAAGKLACRRASLDSQADLRLDPLVLQNRSVSRVAELAPTLGR
jgi:hypothetical protein